MNSACQRRGTALVIALALLTLGAALLTGSAAAGRIAQRSATTTDSAISAELRAREAVAYVVAQWGVAEDNLAVGGRRAWTLPPTGRAAHNAVMTTEMTLYRLSAGRWALCASVRIGPVDAVVARRRILALLDRAPASDTSSTQSPPRLTRRWGLADLY